MPREFEREGYIIAVVKEHSYSVIFCDDVEEAVELSELLGDKVYASLCKVGHSGTVLLAKIVHIDRSQKYADGHCARKKSGSISEMESITGMDISDFLDKQFQASDMKAGVRSYEDNRT